MSEEDELNINCKRLFITSKKQVNFGLKQSQYNNFSFKIYSTVKMLKLQKTFYNYCFYMRLFWYRVNL